MKTDSCVESLDEAIMHHGPPLQRLMSNRLGFAGGFEEAPAEPSVVGSLMNPSKYSFRAIETFKSCDPELGDRRMRLSPADVRNDVQLQYRHLGEIDRVVFKLARHAGWAKAFVVRIERKGAPGVLRRACCLLSENIRRSLRAKAQSVCLLFNLSGTNRAID